MVVVGDVIPVCISSGCTRQTVPNALSEWKRSVKETGGLLFVQNISLHLSRFGFGTVYLQHQGPGVIPLLPACRSGEGFLITHFLCRLLHFVFSNLVIAP